MNKDVRIRAVLRRWRYGIAAAVLAVVTIAGVNAVNRIVDIERYRPKIVEALAHATGMPVTFGRIGVRFLPTPGIKIRDLAIGSGDCHLLIRRASASLRLASLAQRRIAISQVTLSDVSVVLPKDLAALRGLVPPSGTPGATSSLESPQFDIDGLYIHGGEIRHGEGGPLLATFDGVARTLTAETIPVRITAQIPAWGTDTRFVAEGVVAPSQGPAIQGSISLRGLALAALASRPELGTAVADASVALHVSGMQRTVAELACSITGAPHAALNGSLSATAWWQDGALTVNDIQWASTGIAVAGDLTWNPPRQVACRVAKADADASALAALAALWHNDTYRVRPRKNAALAIREVMAGMNPDGEMRLAQGTFTLNGIDCLSADGHRLLAGVHTQISVEEGVVHINELAAEGLTLTGIVHPDWHTRSLAVEGGGSITLAPTWLTLVPAAAPIKDLKGECIIDKASATIVPGQGFPRDLAAAVTLKGVGATILLPGSAEPLTIREMKGGLAFADGTITFDTIEAEGMAVSGTVRPVDGSIALDVSGNVALDRAPLGLIAPKDLLTNWGGMLTVERCKATLSGKGVPADLDVAAGIEDGRVTLSLPGYVDTLSSVTAHVKAGTRAIKADVEVSSAQAGTFSLQGGYEAKTGKAKAALSIDATNNSLPFLKSVEARQTWLPIVHSLGVSTLQIETRWPPPEKKGLHVTVVREGEPPCNAAFTFVQQDGKWKLGEWQSSLTLPLDIVQPLMPKAIEAEGSVVLNARRSAGDSSVALEGDFTDVDAVVGDYLYKKRGDPLAVESVLDPKTGGIGLNAVHIRYGGLDVPVRLQDGGAYVDNADIDLASVAGLLPKQGGAHGHVRGSFGSKPLAATLELDGVGAFIAPEMGIDKVSGKVSVHGTRVVLQEVRAQGLDSDCTFNAELIDGVFHGRAGGSRLNVNKIVYFVDHLKDYRKNPEPENKDAPWHASPFECELQVTLDTLIYRKGAAQHVTGDFSVHQEVVRATHLVATPYTGRLTGTLEIDPSKNRDPGRVVLDFETQDADLRFVDETVFDKPRGLAGTVTGKVAMSILTGTDADAIEGTNGGFQLDAQRGSLGEVGFANQLRNLLKTTTLVRLRLPEYGKDSLGFDQCHANVIMKDGVWTLQEAEMRNPYLAMTADGTIDFPRQDTDIRLRINFLESVTGLLARVPLLGEAISKVGGMTGLDLQVYDSPYDMKVRLRPTQRLENAGKKAGEVVDSITKSLRRKE